jgi:hypothetical protein
MAEGRVAKVMSQGHGVGEILVGAKVLAHAPGDLGHFQSVGQPGSIVVAFVISEDLGFVLEAPEGFGMDDPVSVPLKSCPIRAFLFSVHPSPGLVRKEGIRR